MAAQTPQLVRVARVFIQIFVNNVHIFLREPRSRLVAGRSPRGRVHDEWVRHFNPSKPMLPQRLPSAAPSSVALCPFSIPTLHRRGFGLALRYEAATPNTPPAAPDKKAYSASVSHGALTKAAQPNWGANIHDTSKT